MKVHFSIGSAVLAAVTVVALSACGSTDSAPARLSPAATTSATPPALAAPTEQAGATAGEPAETPEESSSVDGDGGAPAQTVDRPVPATPAAPDPVETEPSSGDGQAPSIMGNWQRHASTIHLDPDPASSTFATGTSCCDGEDWTATWTPIGDDAESGVMVTLVQRTLIYGEGLGGSLYEGKQFEASPSVGYNGTAVLMTYGLGDAPSVNTWCRSGQGVPECGA